MVNKKEKTSYNNALLKPFYPLFYVPTFPGFLLYPDTPAKMETTSREAFCFRPVTQPGRGKGLQSYVNLESKLMVSVLG